MDSQNIIRSMLENIARFFRHMCDNPQKRLYYVWPKNEIAPYAYEHSWIRDLATVHDIMRLVALFQARLIGLDRKSISVFESVIQNTVADYTKRHLKGLFPDPYESNIGDIGFYLVAVAECRHTFPKQLPADWEKCLKNLVEQLLSMQRQDGSFQIFLNNDGRASEDNAEAFYLPEALIGLLAIAKRPPKSLTQIAKHLRTSVRLGLNYMSQAKKREHFLASHETVFYANWQCQFLYHWFQCVGSSTHEVEKAMALKHLRALIDGFQTSQLASSVFHASHATVEIACYLEAMAHAKRTLLLAKVHEADLIKWIDIESLKCVDFLYRVQQDALKWCHGGFVHALHSREARVDVSGHVFSALGLMLGGDPDLV